jgi:hypothetical protein
MEDASEENAQAEQTATTGGHRHEIRRMTTSPIHIPIPEELRR